MPKTVDNSEETEQSSLPEEDAPVIRSVTLSDRTTCRTVYGAYVQQLSRLQVVVDAVSDGQVTIETACGGLTAYGSRTLFALPTCGAVPIAVRVTDSRGRSAEYETAVTVLPYEPPKVILTDCARGSAGFTAEIAPLNGRNRAEYTLLTRPRGRAEWTETVLADCRGDYDPACVAPFTPETDSALEVCIRAADDFGSADSNIALLSSAFPLMDFAPDSRAVGIGTRAAGENRFSLGLDTDLGGHSLTGLPSPAADDAAATRAYADTKTAMALVWENPSVSASFGNSDGSDKTVAMNLQGYDAVIALFRATTSNATVMPANFVPVGAAAAVLMISAVNDSKSEVAFSRRVFTVSRTGISFEPCRQKSVSSRAAAGTNNGQLIPWRIIGIRGIEA